MILCKYHANSHSFIFHMVDLFSLSFNWPMARLMLYDTAVLLFLTAERADERLDAVINREPSLDCKNRPLSRTDCQRDWMNEFSRSTSKKNSHMTKIVYPDMKPLFTGKESFHILDAECRNAKQMISIGTRHNTCHLFLSEVAAERKRRSIRHLIGTIHDRCRQQLRPVIPSSQLHALLEREVWCGKKLMEDCSLACRIYSS